MIKKQGTFVRVSWDEALNEMARVLSAIKETTGPDSFAALASAKCTNEENYLLQKFVRAVMGTNNIDHCARL
jgi:predicted molibdopterin-dependent oxidoreductase YjgC